jgi:hypothetical protein
MCFQWLSYLAVGAGSSFRFLPNGLLAFYQAVSGSESLQNSSFLTSFLETCFVFFNLETQTPQNKLSFFAFAVTHTLSQGARTRRASGLSASAASGRARQAIVDWASFCLGVNQPILGRGTRFSFEADS